MIEPVYSFGRLNVVVRQRGSVMKQRGAKVSKIIAKET